MQNAQSTETQQRVMNLVELYRTKVGKESEIAQAAKADSDYWEQESVNMFIEEGLSVGVYGTGPHTEIWTKHLMVNEQLLGHFYTEVAGKDAEQSVLDQLLPDVYDKTVFTEEEESFLKSHFKELVNYIILTPCDDSLEWVNSYDSKDVLTIPSEVLNLISSRVEMEPGSKIYYPDAGFAQLTNLFKDSKFFCGGDNAWMRVAIYANGIDAELVDGNMTQQSYDAIVSFIPTENSWSVKHICEVFENLNQGGKLILLCQSSVLAAKDYFLHKRRLVETLKYKEIPTVRSELELDAAREEASAELRKRLAEDGTIKEIIKLPQVMSKNASYTYCLLIAEKGQVKSDATLIDARPASVDIDTKHYRQLFDMDKFYAILNNDGKDPNTGLRKVVKVSTENLSQDLLVPEVYTVERPSEIEHPVPLSNLCTLESALVRDVQYDLPEDTPWITMSDLTPLFTGDMDMSEVKKADCPNNPLFVGGSKDYAFGKDGKFVDSIWVQMNTKKGNHVLEYRQCTFLDGNTDAVLYERSDKHGVQIAVVRATGKPYVVSKGILVFCPKNGFDAYSLAALLRLPIVYRQLAAYQKYGIGYHLDDVFVPTDKRIIYDEGQKMLKEQNVVGDLEEKLTNKEKSLRMRKHALTQSLSSIKAMFVALNSYRKRKDGHIDDKDVISRIQGTTVQDAFEFIHKGIFEMMPALEHIADVEYSFSKVEPFDPEEFMEVFIAKEEKGWLNFKPVVTWKKGSNKAKSDICSDEDGSVLIAKGKPLNRITFPKDALEKIFENIISNAKAYAFTDDTRKDYQLRFSWHTEGTSLIIEIENNGTPIPEDRDTTSLLEYGVSTALHHDGHNGIGCNEIDSIMRQYNGKVVIVSTPEELFTVKYVLTFNDSNTYQLN